MRALVTTKSTESVRPGKGITWRRSRLAYWFRQIGRFFSVATRYRRAGLSFALRVLELMPGFDRSIQHRQDRYQTKLQLRASQRSVGHALGDRYLVCSLFGREFLRFRLPEGVQATADQFYLNRPVRDAEHLIALAAPYVEIRPGDLVFDPGCGAGRHLHHLVDRYGCEAIGVDIYGPAIEVAKAASRDGRERFLAQSSLAPGLLDSLLPDGCDFVFINSWLNHVKDYPGYREFSFSIVEKCRYLLVITSAKDRMEALFANPRILAHDIRNGTQYVLIEGALSKKAGETPEADFSRREDSLEMGATNE